MKITLPDCPTCGHVATAPVRQGMSAMPYKCSNCNAAFNLVIAASNVSQLRETYKDTPADEVMVGTNCKIAFPQP